MYTTLGLALGEVTVASHPTFALFALASFVASLVACFAPRLACLLACS